MMRNRATFGQPERVPRVRSHQRTGPDLGKFFADRSTRLGNSSGEEERRQEVKVARTAIVTGRNKQKDRLNKTKLQQKSSRNSGNKNRVETRGNIIIYFFCSAQIALSQFQFFPRDRRSLLDFSDVSRRLRLSIENEFFANDRPVKHRGTIERKKQNCHRSMDENVVDLIFFTATYPFLSVLQCPNPLLLPDYYILICDTNPADTSRFPTLTTPPPPNIPSHNQPVLPPVPPNRFTSVSECVNTCKDLKRRKEIQRISRRNGGKKNEESVEQNAIVRIDLKRITGKMYTHTHSSDCVGTFCINCVRHETEGESVRV